MRNPHQPTLAEQLHELAREVARLRPDWNNPARFFERRSELAAQLRKAAMSTELPR